MMVFAAFALLGCIHSFSMHLVPAQPALQARIVLIRALISALVATGPCTAIRTPRQPAFLVTGLVNFHTPMPIAAPTSPHAL